MEEKKSDTRSLLVFLLILLIIVIAVMSYFIYENINEKNEKDNEISELNDRISKLENSENGNQERKTTNENKINFSLGTYKMEENRYIYDPDLGDYGANITFAKNNEFKASLTWGGTIEGTYEVIDNGIKCTFTKFVSEYETSQKVEGSISFEIIEDDIIKIAKASESIEIYVIDIVNKELTDETKELYIEPYIKGMEFRLDK